MEARLIRAKTVMERTGLGRSTLYARSHAGTFPRPVPLGRAMPGWIESEVQAWIDGCIERRRATPWAGTASSTPSSLLRLKAVMASTGLSRSTIYALGRVGEFPSRVSIGGGASAWVKSEVGAWIDARVRLRSSLPHQVVKPTRSDM